MAELVLGNNQVATYSMDEAKEVIAGYAFGTTGVDRTWESKRVEGLAGQGEEGSRNRRCFSYKSYDCVPASKGGLTYQDVLLTAGLESKINSERAGQVMSAEPVVSHCLETLKLENVPPFWALEEAEVTDWPQVGERAYWIWIAWEALVSLKGIKVAIVHKVLHHKDPLHFPLVDNVTVKAYGKNAWLGIHSEVRNQEKEFVALERWFEDLAHKHGGVTLNRLRLHDILLWADLSGSTTRAGMSNRELARKKGRVVLNGN